MYREPSEIRGVFIRRLDIESSCIAKTLFGCEKWLMESSSSPDDMYRDQNVQAAYDQDKVDEESYPWRHWSVSILSGRWLL